MPPFLSRHRPRRDRRHRGHRPRPHPDVEGLHHHPRPPGVCQIRERAHDGQMGNCNLSRTLRNIPKKKQFFAEWLQGKYGSYGPKYWFMCTPWDSPLSLILCQNVIFFHQILDVNIKFRYCLIIIDHQIDEKTSHFGIKWHSVNLEWFYRPTASELLESHFMPKCDVFFINLMVNFDHTVPKHYVNINSFVIDAIPFLAWSGPYY